MTVSRLPIPTEHQEQRALLDWCFTQRVSHPELRWVFAVPNGGKRDVVTATLLKREGVKPGYPDIGLDVARGNFHGLRIEMKKRRDSTFTPKQAEWRDWLLSQGYAWHLCFGWEKARDALLEYLALPSCVPEGKRPT